MIFSRAHLRKQQGAALALALFATAALGAALMVVLAMAEAFLADSSWEDQRAVAKRVALSGIAIGSNPSVMRGDALLRSPFANGQNLDVSVLSENARLGINSALESGWLRELERLFIALGLDSQRASSLADCLADWVDSNDEERLNGAENEAYRNNGFTNYPSNASFKTLDEMALVQGMDALEKVRPNWRDYFSVLATGGINPNDAEPELIAAICGLELSQLTPLLQVRSDRMAQQGAAAAFKDLEEVRRLLGISEDAFQKISEKLALDTSLRRIRSIGRAGKTESTIEAVVQTSGGSQKMLLWQQR